MILKKGLFCFLLLISRLNPANDLNSDENPSYSFGLETDFNSQYIWRGISFNKGFIIQPSPWISFSDFTLSIWGNFPLYDVNSYEGDEIDFCAAYLFSFESLSLETSLNYYNYPGQLEAPSTAEGNLKFSYKISGWDIYSNFNFDVLEYSGSFASDAGMSYEINLKETAISVDLNAGWAGRKFNQVYINPEYERSSINYLIISISANYYLTDQIYLKPHIEYCSILNAVLAEVSGNHLSNFGVLVGAEF
jgi:hypothetical protein